MIQFSRHASILLLALAASACQGTLTTGEPLAPRDSEAVEASVRGERTEVLAAEGLLDLQPSDIAVVPIDNLTGLDDLPLANLRAAFASGLIERLYTPLALDFVDRHWDGAAGFASGASFSTENSPAATLFVTVTGWNDSSLTSKGVLAAGLELRLVEGASESGRLLWGRRLERVVDVVDSSNRPAGLRRELYPRALKALVGEVLAELPERDLRSAPRDPELLQGRR